MLSLATLPVIPYPAIDPIALVVGPVAIRWYGLAYAVGFIVGWWYLIRMNRGAKAALSRHEIDDLAFWAMLGVIVGGRLGSVLFYDLDKYLAQPLKIFAIWEGGMSFHGGLLGVIVAVLLFCGKRGLSFLKVSDRVACVTPIGLFLGRLANFVNGELWGRPTDAPWAMVFPAADELPRHPSQLYEAALEGVALFVILNLLFHFSRLRDRPGALFGLFLIGYSAFRMAVEQVREPDVGVSLFLDVVTRGQLLSVPMMAVGLALLAFALVKRAPR